MASFRFSENFVYKIDGRAIEVAHCIEALVNPTLIHKPIKKTDLHIPMLHRYPHSHSMPKLTHTKDKRSRVIEEGTLASAFTHTCAHTFS